MVKGIQLKVCGVRTLEIATFAARSGADYLGFNFFPSSPRFIPLETYRAFSEQVTAAKKVAVLVEPSVAELETFRLAGFNLFQVHFRPETPIATVESWARTVGVESLWLAPKLPPGAELPVSLLPLAAAFLIDTFDPVKFGGTGRTGDWSKFARLRLAHPTKTWMLSGGLNAGNIAEAVRATNASFVDVNSGVESSLGIKDPAKITAFIQALERVH